MTAKRIKTPKLFQETNMSIKILGIRSASNYYWRRCHLKNYLNCLSYFNFHHSVPVIHYTHNHEVHGFCNLCNFSWKFSINSSTEKKSKIASICTKLCPWIAESKFQLSLWRLWKYWRDATNSWQPCIKPWLAIQVCMFIEKQYIWVWFL